MISGEGNDSDKDLATPPRKKLKQARLSFQKLSPSLESTSPKSAKKRKIRDSNDDIKVAKIIKPNDESFSVVEKDTNSPVITLDDSNQEQNSEQCDLKEKENFNSENVHLENKKLEIITLTEESEKESPVTEKVEEICVNSSNEEIVVDIDSESSESDSEESDDENELNETVEGLNSSGSHEDFTSKEELGTNLPKISDSNTKADVMTTPKSNVVKTDIVKKKQLTPKQLLQREEAAKKREEKEKQRKEKEKRKAEEKEVKKKEKLERKEKRQKEKEEKEEQRKKEKEEKEKKKQAELELKSEEKRLKEEERRKKEEQRVLEKKKKDGKKFAEEEAKKKEAAAFVNFFLSKGGMKSSSEDVKIKAAENFMPFEVKVDMRLAPAHRTDFSKIRMETLDKMLEEQCTSDLYLTELKRKSYNPGNSGNTWPLSDLREVIILDEDDDVIPVTEENEVVESHPNITHPKAKLLLFCENRRPPYWGTWSKRSKLVKPTQPFNKDQIFFDYEVDSDDEWEEEEPGESLHGSDDEKESEDEYEVDNEFFVPHGYLSDEENCEEEETLSPEIMKAKLKMLEMEFEEEMKHKTERVKPRLLGCFWVNQNTNPVGARVLGLLSSYRAVFRENPITVKRPSTPERDSPINENQGTCPPSGSKKKKFPESFVPALIKLIHGNINGRGFLVKEFSEYVRSQLRALRDEQQTSDNAKEDTPLSASAGMGMISKLKISEKIKEVASWIACPEDGPFLNRMCWYVSTEIRSAYGVDDLVIPNKVWNYIITPKRELELSNMIPSPSVTSDTNPRHKSLPLITKFTKKITQEELQKQLLLSGSCEDDLEVLEVKTNSTCENAGKNGSKKLTSVKADTSLNNREQTETSRSTPMKSSTQSAGVRKQKKSSETTGIRGKLMQFKLKGSSIIPHLEQRKRVQILKSVPLGQVISTSTPKVVSTCVQEDKKDGNQLCVDENSSGTEDCVIVSD